MRGERHGIECKEGGREEGREGCTWMGEGFSKPLKPFS